MTRRQFTSDSERLRRQSWQTAPCSSIKLLDPIDLGRSRAFTLLELLVICGLLSVLALTLGPALARSERGGRALQCMNKHRQLCAAWRMYAGDNSEQILYSSDDGTGTSPYSQNSFNVLNNFAWTWSKMDFSGGNVYNSDPAADIVLRPLWPYTGKDTNLFKCPSDRSYVVVSGQAKPRVRSFSMNFFLGGFGGGYAGASDIDYQLYLKLSEISVPNQIFVFLDVRADNINWGNFQTHMNGYPNNPAAYQLKDDFPGFYHDQSCTFSFVDGHVEEKRWLDTRTRPPPGVNLLDLPAPVPYDPDVGWLQDHSTRPR